MNVISYLPSLRDLFQKKKSNKSEQESNSIGHITEKADHLYSNGNYQESYELLNDLKITNQFYSNAEVLWRLCRALFRMSHDDSLSKMRRKEMIDEAYDLICIPLSKGESHHDLHKWMAILLSAKAEYEGTLSKVKSSADIKNHMLKALELNCNDILVLYMLGCWSYNIASLNWFQRKFIHFWYGDIPTSSYQDAYLYFQKIDDLSATRYLSNTYMLGKVSYCMKQYYRARYYLKIASHMPASNKTELKFSQKAKNLSEDLEKYDLSQEALLSYKNC